MDPVLRENFIEHIFLYHRRQSLLRSGLTPARLVDFHTNHKFSVLAHDEAEPIACSGKSWPNPATH